MISIYMRQTCLCQNKSTCLDTNNELDHLEIIANQANQHRIGKYINRVKASQLHKYDYTKN